MERSPLCAAVQYVSVIRAEADPNEDETRAPGSRRRILWCFCLVRCCSSVTGEDPHSSFTHLFFLLVITSTCRLRLERINKVTHQMHVAARSVDWIRRNYTENAASCVCANGEIPFPGTVWNHGDCCYGDVRRGISLVTDIRILGRVGASPAWEAQEKHLQGRSPVLWMKRRERPTVPRKIGDYSVHDAEKLRQHQWWMQQWPSINIQAEGTLGF